MRSDGWVARCEELVKIYVTPTSKVHALNGITAEFPRAALTAIVGPSGSGKSSLLRLLSGMDHPTSGSIRVGPVEVRSASSRQLRALRRQRVGYVFQRPSDNFIPYLTVGEHLQLAAQGSAAPPWVDMHRLLEELGVGHRMDHLPAELSGGEQQRAAFAQALVGGAEIVVADEPTAELDSTSAGALIEKVHGLVDAGISVVVATHDPQVQRKAESVIHLDHGVIRRAGPLGGSSGMRAAVAPSSWAPGGRDPTKRWLPPGERAGAAAPAAAAGTEAAGPALLRIEGVSKSFRRGDEIVHAVQDVNLSVGEEEVVGLVGRSGSGKTTLLSLVAGWEQPDVGTIQWEDGRPLGGLMPWREVSVLPQKFGLIDELTVRQNMAYPARLAGTLGESETLLDELVESLGLTELQSRYPKETSIGEQQRTALARALVLSPRLLLADEPSGHQDRGFHERVFATLRRAAARGTTCLVATHNEEAAPFLDRVVHISDGRIAE
ncbi:MAG: ABC transporter ATP-binding protein [Actinomycetota bacterium]